MNRSLSVHALLFASVAFALPVAAQAPGGGAAAGGRMFDPSTVTTVSGPVEALNEMKMGLAVGVHVTLKTAEGMLDIHLGPAWYLREQPVKIEKGDTIEVTGSRIEVGGKPALIAQTVKKGGATLTLRDAAGVPAWSGQRRR